MYDTELACLVCFRRGKILIFHLSSQRNLRASKVFVFSSLLTALRPAGGDEGSHHLRDIALAIDAVADHGLPGRYVIGRSM